MKLIKSLRGPMTRNYYGVKSVCVRHEGEKLPRPCKVVEPWVGEPFRIHPDEHWSDIVDGVALGRFVPDFPEIFQCKVRHAMRVIVGDKLVDALPGETVEVKRSVQIAICIAKRMLRPIDPELWAPDRLYLTGRVREIMEKPPSDFIKLPDMKAYKKT